MPNHIHLVAVPRTGSALARAIGQTHEAYTRYINFRQGWRGYLWQGRFSSFPVDETRLPIVARYVELNPIMAGLVAQPEHYPWSSASGHLNLVEDSFMNKDALLKRAPPWGSFLDERVDDRCEALLEKHENTGRPFGSPEFLRRLEERTGLAIVPRKRGRKPRTSGKNAIQSCVPK
jgi:putative transposase